MTTDSIAVSRVSPGLLFSYPFRIFFLSLAVFGVIYVPLWVAQVYGAIDLPLAFPDLRWHRHEMLFGFLSAAIAGFLLTAVCVWTGTERLHGRRLFGLWLVWLAGRILLVGGENVPVALVHLVNLSFLPLVMIDAGWRIWQARQRRQLVILVVLGLFWAMQVGFVLTFNPVFVSGGLVMAMTLSGVIGGRITPAFSSGWLRQQGRDSSTVKVVPRLDALGLASMVILLITLLVGNQWGTGLAALVAALLMLARIVGWKGWLVASNPLLWILHVSLLWIPIALFLLAGNQLLDWTTSAWVHAVGVGVVGSLVLGVIARVSLGHTGRPLVLPSGMLVAFVMIQAAAVVRVMTAFGVIEWGLGVKLSGALWVLSFFLLLIRYAGILMKPRVDGLEG